jgi:outer membrane protein TolC
MKHNIKRLSLTLMVVAFCFNALQAQSIRSYSLEQLKDAALKNNHTLAIKEWQVKEKQAKFKEDEIKRYPSATLNGNYQYNFNIGELTIPAGTIGELELSPGNSVLLPNVDKKFTIGEHNNYNVGVTAYQPITQQAKIKTLLEIDKIDVQLTEKDRLKISLQVKQAIDRLYYGTLIAKKQLEEAEAKLALAKSKLTDVENALQAGKTVTADEAGLQANIANEEQNIIKFNFQIQDYMGDLMTLTGINADSLNLEEVEPTTQPLNLVDEYKNVATNSNTDLQTANLTKSKAELGIKAAKQSNRPDFGLMAGYAYQYGNPVLPSNNPFVGVNLKWELKDIFSNKHVISQRKLQLKQAQENIINTQEQVSNDIEKVYRKLNHTQVLITAAQKTVVYRKEELKIQEDKKAAGLNVQTDLLNAKSLLAKAEADMYSAQLSYMISLSDLKLLTGE